MGEQIEVSDDALKLLVAEHGIRGTARLLQMDDRQTMAFRQRATRGKWMQDPAIAAIRANAITVSPANVAKPIVANVSPQAAVMAELQALGSETRVSLARGIAKAGKHIAELSGPDIVADAGNVKSIAQTADLVHGWKDSAPQVKIRLDVLNGSAETPVFDVEATAEPIASSWDESVSTDVDDY